jgi:hypothetical protein
MDYPYLRAYAQIAGWGSFTLGLLLLEARDKEAPSDAYTYLPLSGGREPKTRSHWRRFSELEEEVQAGGNDAADLLGRLREMVKR